jgi:hypothetical protein
MTQEINRVIVPLDAASETGAAIDTAARLAARWRVPLHGVFVEDEELIGLASLPFARQVTLGAGVEPLTKDRVEDHFRAFAERARREFAAAAERHDVKWSFESVRGPLAPDMLGGEHDFVVAGAAEPPDRRPLPHRLTLLVLDGYRCTAFSVGKSRVANRGIGPHPAAPARSEISAGARHSRADRRLL